MRKLTAGNKSRFAVFVILIISIIAILVIFLSKVLKFEKEEYEIDKNIFIYDKNYEYIDLTADAVIAKKWTGEYYLNEPETGLSYDLGPAVIAYDSLKNRITLYGTFFEVGLDGQVTKTKTKTDITDMQTPKLYKIEDRKYLLIAGEMVTENGTLTAENYLMIILDKSGNTLLLNNNIDVKTINAIILETSTFKFDVANEKLLYNESEIDLKKIIGSTNLYVEPEEEPEEENTENGGTTINVGGSSANSSSSSIINIGGTTVINPGSGNDSSDNNNDDDDDEENNNNTTGGIITEDTNSTKVVKSASLRSIVPGTTYLDVNYLITDPENRYQVVYLTIEGGGMVDTISLDKTSSLYRITGLKPNTDYNVTLGYKEIKNDNTLEEVIEDVLNVRTAKLGGEFSITKVTPTKIYFNLKLDQNSEYDNATVKVLLDGNEIMEELKVNTEQAIKSEGWSSEIERTEDMIGKLTLKLDKVNNVELSISTQIY